MPAMIGMRTCVDLAEEPLELRDVEHGLRDRVLGARFHLVLEPLELERGSIAAGFTPTPIAYASARRSGCRRDRARDSGC